MHFTIGTVLAVLPLLATATPVAKQPRATIPLHRRNNLVKDDGSVNADALRAQLARATSKVQNGFAAYQRNTGQVHSLARNSSSQSKRKTGTDALTDDSEQLWYGEISVGTPPVTYKVDFDTGSSDLFLPGPDCSENCDGHKAYNPKASSSSSDVGKDFSLQYGDGSTVSGEQYNDAVTISGLTGSKATVGAAKQYSTGFSSKQFPADGLMGMGFKSISEYNADPVFQVLMKDGQTDKGEFGFKLSKSGAGLTVGGTDSSAYSGDFTYAKVTQEGYWQVDLDGISVGGKSAVDSTSAIIDSGTTLIVGDSDGVKQFYAGIDGAKEASSLGEGMYTVPCSSIPQISLTFNGKSFDVSSSTFNLGPASSGSSDCVGGIAASSASEGFWIVGDVFMQNVYTVFDVDNSQVGFAALS
ncbi:hypothetical protein PLICRDRAFT_101811 [Plicaturopsis crispa FD-325 SS-3]|nr:hypothetical protein PLICRDRAFT_101811 [Plicaturopsis crispa FD-325 SS-3]